MFQATAVEKIKTYFVLKNFFENCAVHDIMWKNIVQSDKPQVTVWRSHIICWILKAADTNSEYLLLFHCNNGCTKAPECYVIRMLPFLLNPRAR